MHLARMLHQILVHLDGQVLEVQVHLARMVHQTLVHLASSRTRSG